MARTIRWAMAGLLLGAGLLLPVLLHGQPPVIARSEPVVVAPSPPRLPLPDDGLTTPLPYLRPQGPVARGMEVAPALRPVGHLEQREPSPLDRSLIQAAAVMPVLAQPPVATTPRTQNVPRPQVTGPLHAVTTAALTIEVLGPRQVVLNETLPCELVVRNHGTQVLASVRVELPLPAGLRLVAAEPMPEIQPERLVWDLGVLEVRGERRLRLDLLVHAVTDLALQPQTTYRVAAYRPEVVRPTFAVQQVGPEMVPRGTTTKFRLQVTNHGSRPLEKVVLWDRLPTGLHHAQGPTLVAELGRLAPGESRAIEVDLHAHRTGRWVNEIIAEAEDGSKATTRATVTVAEPNLSVRLLGPERAGVGAEADWRLEIVNSRQGPAAHNLRATLTLPEGLDPVQATTQARIDALNRRIVWQLGTLEPGQLQTVLVKARCLAAGTWTTQAVVQAEQLATVLAEQSVQVVPGEGGSRLELTVRVAQDHLEVADETVYEVRLGNLSGQPETNLRLSAWVPEGLVPLRAEGATAARIQQQQVQFAPLPTLEPRATAIYRVHVRGQRPGTWRLRVEAVADGQARPLIEECPVLVQNGR